jgi:hypothetical protein
MQTFSQTHELFIAGQKNNNFATYPVWLCRAPLYLIDLSLSGGVGEDGILNSPRHLLYVPDERLMIVPGCADVAGGMGGPSNTVHACAMVVQPKQTKNFLSVWVEVVQLENRQVLVFILINHFLQY